MNTLDNTVLWTVQLHRDQVIHFRHDKLQWHILLTLISNNLIVENPRPVVR